MSTIQTEVKARKHPQSILAMDAEFFFGNPDFISNINKADTKEWMINAHPFLIIGERNRLETDKRYKQLLPYVIVRQVGKDNILRYQPYRRTSGVGESRLAGNVSIGYGGHIDVNDVLSDTSSVIDLSLSLAIAIQRELDEEIKITNLVHTEVSDVASIDFANLFIIDDSNDVGQVHLGIVVYCDIPTDIKIHTKEDELVSMAPMTLEELLNSELPLENWTKIFLENVNKVEEVIA